MLHVMVLQVATSIKVHYSHMRTATKNNDVKQNILMCDRLSINILFLYIRVSSTLLLLYSE